MKAPHGSRYFVLQLLACATTAIAVLLGDPTGLRQVFGSESNLDQEVRELAKQVARFLGENGEQRIAVGEWSPPPKPLTSSGPGIKKTLRDELEFLMITDDSDAKFTVKGDYLATTDKESGRTVAKLAARILDSESGDEVLKLAPRGVHGEREVARIFGLTTSLPPDESGEGRDEKIKESIKSPSVTIDGTQVMSTAGSPYRVEILTKASPGESGEPRAPRERDGMAFVEIRRDDFYEVRIINNSEHDTGITLSVDGLDVFTFSDEKSPDTGKPRYTFLIVPKNKSVSVKGWHRTNKVADSFVVTEFSKSAAGKLLRSPSSVGTITVTFAAAWEDEKSRPRDEGAWHTESSKDVDATGQGPPVEANLKEVQRFIGKLRSTVSIRYSKPEVEPLK